MARRRHHGLRVGNQKGLAFLELLLVVGIIGTLATIGLPKIDPHQLDLSTSMDGLAGNLKMARTWATGRGVHFQVELTVSSYTVQRLEDPDEDGVWTVDATIPSQEFILPDRITLSTSGDTTIEFNSRGLLVPEAGEVIASIRTLTLTDTSNSKASQVVIWPSGQVLEF